MPRWFVIWIVWGESEVFFVGGLLLDVGGTVLLDLDSEISEELLTVEAGIGSGRLS